MYRSEELLNKLFYVVEYNRVNASARIKKPIKSETQLKKNRKIVLGSLMWINGPYWARSVSPGNFQIFYIYIFSSIFQKYTCHLKFRKTSQNIIPHGVRHTTRR